MTEKNNVTTLPPRDPIFALAPELKLHQSKIDGQTTRIEFVKTMATAGIRVIFTSVFQVLT